MKIGLLGLDFSSGNLGCSALAYSFLLLVDECAKQNKETMEICVFANCKAEIDTSYYSNYLSISQMIFHYRNPLELFKLWNVISKCDAVYDFTSGDSFADIYGSARFYKTSVPKMMTILSTSKLRLGPQTYGPFQKGINEHIAAYIIKHSDSVFTRDEMSQKYVYNISKRKISSEIDVAFSLPYSDCKLDDNVVRVGINVSGLLWNGGYNQSNQFKLTVDYREYIHKIINWFIGNNVEVHLISHVFAEELPVEDDYAVCRSLKKDYHERCIAAPKFTTPMEAKSYISKMDFFIGARMHSTIGALSAGVCVLPFAYSRKFKGLFHSIGYDYVLEATSLSTDEAIEYTKNVFQDIENVRKCMIAARNDARQRIKLYKNRLQKELSNER